MCRVGVGVGGGREQLLVAAVVVGQSVRSFYSLTLNFKLELLNLKFKKIKIIKY